MQKIFLLIVLLSLVFLAGCAQQKVACTDVCNVTSSPQCVGSGFYACQVNADGCRSQVLVAACGGDYACADAERCVSPSEKSVVTVVAVQDIVQGKVTQGMAYQQDGKSCTVVQVVNETAVVACEENTQSAATAYKVECTQNCDRGLDVVKYRYKSVMNGSYSDEVVVSLQNANPRSCAMACTVVQGVYGQENMFTVAAGVTQDVTLRTNTPSNMQVWCSEVANGTNTGCNDRVREVFTSRWVGQARTY